jgi:hypothetical protein
MTTAALAFAAAYGAEVPINDDWFMVPALAGEEELASWLWAQHNQHRFPIAKAIFYTSFRLTGGFRTGLLLSVGLLSASAACLLYTARRMRGRSRLSDAFFPLALLCLGQWQNLVWSYQVAFTLPVFLSCLILSLAVRAETEWTPRAAVTAGLCVALMPLCGAIGLLLLPGLSVWLFYLARFLRHLPTPGRKLAHVAVALALFGAAALVLIYFHGYTRVKQHPSSPSLWAALESILAFLSLGLGTGGRFLWPAKGVGVAACLLLTAVRLFVAFRRDRGGRLRSLGLLLFLSSFVCLAVGIGWGRAGFGLEYAFESRYVALATPAVCAAYLAWEHLGKTAGRVIQTALCSVACLLFVPNVDSGLQPARALHSHVVDFEHDVLAGIPRPELVARYHRLIASVRRPADFAEDLASLRRAGFGIFKQLQEQPVGGPQE